MSGEQHFYLGNVTNVHGTGNIGSVNFGATAQPGPEQLALLRSLLAELRRHVPEADAQRLDETVTDLDPTGGPAGETAEQRGARLNRALETARRIAETARSLGPGVVELANRIIGMASGG
ncbi:hypothetical protein ACFV1L_03470 [Kitasatospora sp. NPDC059646]|uniref:hypothetical protein n=1 Tax=Kitasatospora sp. NPDC059646 TaxID=3346893 RepID=UPI0036AD4A69